MKSRYRNKNLHPILYSPSESVLWFGLFYFLRPPPVAKGFATFLLLMNFLCGEWREGCLPAKSAYNLPKFSAIRGQLDLRRRKKITWSTLQCYVPLPQMEQADSSLQIGVSLVGRNVIKVSHKIKKILWPFTSRKNQRWIIIYCRPLKNIVFCSKPHFLQVIIPQLIQYAKIPLNAISHPMTSAKDLLPQNPRSFG